MANFKSDVVTLNASAETVFERIGNPENLKELLQKAPADQIPADKREMLDNIKVTADSVSFPGGPAGEITLYVTERKAPVLILMEGKDTPVPLSMGLHITPLTADSCDAYIDLDVKIPAMILPMVKGTLQKLIEQCGQMLRMIRF